MNAFGTYQTSASFAVSYSSNDAASGVANVHLWVETPGAGSYSDLGVWTSGDTYTATAGEGLYQFYTVATDNAGNVESAPVAAHASTTLDTGLQGFAISSPTSGATLNTSTVTISGTASDTTSGLQKVEVQIDSSSTWNLASTSDSFADWSYQTTLADGSHTITAKVTDNAGNTETTSVTFTVQSIVETQLTVKITPTTYNKDNPQTLTITGTLTDANSNPLADQQVTLWYDQGTPQNWIQIDPKATISTDSKGVYSYDWTTLPSNLANGFYVIEARFALNSPYQSTFADTRTPGNGDSLNVLPEYAFGALAALGACFIGFVVFKKRSNLPHLRLHI